MELFFVDLDYEVRSVAAVPGVLSHRGRFLPLIQVCIFYCVVADRNRFDADPDLTSCFDADPHPDPTPSFYTCWKISSIISHGNY